MVTKILSLLSANKLLIGAILIFIAFSYYQNSLIDNLNAKLDSKNSELIVLQLKANSLESDLALCHEKLKSQNAKIKAIEAKKPNESQIKEQVITQFKEMKVPVKDTTCETKLKFYERLINEMAN